MAIKFFNVALGEGNHYTRPGWKKFLTVLHTVLILGVLGLAFVLDRYWKLWRLTTICLYILGPLVALRIYLFFTSQSIRFAHPNERKRWPRYKRRMFKCTPAFLIAASFCWYWFDCVWYYVDAFKHPLLILSKTTVDLHDTIANAVNNNPNSLWPEDVFNETGYKMYGFLHVYQPIGSDVVPSKIQFQSRSHCSAPKSARKKSSVQPLNHSLQTCGAKDEYEDMIYDISTYQRCAQRKGYDITYWSTQLDGNRFSQEFDLNIQHVEEACTGTKALDKSALTFEIILNQNFFYNLPEKFTKADGEYSFPHIYLEIYPRTYDMESYDFGSSVSTLISNHEMALIEYSSLWTVHEKLNGERMLWLNFADEGHIMPVYDQYFIGSGGNIYFPQRLYMNLQGFYKVSGGNQITTRVNLEQETRKYDFNLFMSGIAGVLSLSLAAFGFLFPDTLPIRWVNLGEPPPIPGLEAESRRETSTIGEFDAGIGGSKPTSSLLREPMMSSSRIQDNVISPSSHDG